MIAQDSHDGGPIRLEDWVERYELSHELSEESALYYRRAVRTFEQWAGEELTSQTIRDELVNRAILALIKAGRSAHYARSLKSGVMAIWRDMADAGVCEYPRRIRPIRSGAPTIKIWTPEQIAQLVEAAQMSRGSFSATGLQRSMYWATMIRVAWDTGLRRRDIQQLRRRDVADSWVQVQHKTGKRLKCRLRPSTMAMIQQWGRLPDAILWPSWGTDESFRRAFGVLVQKAGLSHGPWKQIRKSAGTAAEAIQPGGGHHLLGNTRRVFERHYLDPSKVDAPQPPELDS